LPGKGTGGDRDMLDLLLAAFYYIEGFIIGGPEGEDDLEECDDEWCAEVL